MTRNLHKFNICTFLHYISWCLLFHHPVVVFMFFFLLLSLFCTNHVFLYCTSYVIVLFGEVGVKVNKSTPLDSLSFEMGSPMYNRFNLLEDFAETSGKSRSSTVSPPIKKSKKKTPVLADSPEEKRGPSTDESGKIGKGKARSRVPIDQKAKAQPRNKMEAKGSPRKPNRKLVLSDSEPEIVTETKRPESPKTIDPSPPDAQSRSCPATNYYVGLAKEHHVIPTMEELLDRAGAFGRMFEGGKPVDCMAGDIVNIEGIYGMLRPRFHDRKIQWELKASLVFFEQGLIQQIFEREKIVLFFSLIRKYRHRIPNLFRLYDSVYNLDQAENVE